MTKGQLFIAGATGHTGRELVRLAAEQDLATTAHVRPDSSKLDHWREHFEACGARIDTTAWDEDALKQTLGELAPTTIFALLGTTRSRAKRESAQQHDPINYDTVDYGLTAQLIRAASTLPSPPRFVYLSSTGMPTSEPRNGSYMHARWKVEQLLLDGSLPYTIARPSFISGPGRDEPRLGERIGSVVIDGALSLATVFGGRRFSERYRSTTSVTLASALLKIAHDPTLENSIVESEGLR